MTAEEKQNRLNLIGSLVAGTAVATGNANAAAVATGAASVETDNNRMLQQNETAKLQQLEQGKSKAAQQRLIDAACALTHCSAGVPDSDSVTKAALQASEQRGKQYVTEQSQLVATGLFTYDGFSDALNDAVSRYQVSNRAVGAVQGVLGSAAAAGEMTGGCATIVLCGLSTIAAGIFVLESGKDYEAFLNLNGGQCNFNVVELSPTGEQSPVPISPAFLPVRMCCFSFDLATRPGFSCILLSGPIAIC